MTRATGTHLVWLFVGVFAILLVPACSEPTAPSSTASNDGGSVDTSGTGTAGSTTPSGGADTSTSSSTSSPTTSSTTQNAQNANAQAAPQLSEQADAQAAQATRNQLKQIVLSLHSYHDKVRSFPPTYTITADGKPALSWRVFVLPFLGHSDLYGQFRLDEPWDSEHNKTLIAQMPPVFRSPKNTLPEGKTAYLTVRGPQSLFPPTPEAEAGKGLQSAARKIRDVIDGTSNTIAVVEVNDQHAVIWTAPEDYQYDPAEPLAGLRGVYRHGFPAAFCDGSVQFLTESVEVSDLNAMFTANAGDVVNR